MPPITKTPRRASAPSLAFCIPCILFDDARSVNDAYENMTMRLGLLLAGSLPAVR
jgi:hypothetical protein